MKTYSPRLATLLTQAAKTKRKLLIPYLVAGDPSPPDSVNLMHALVAGGADLIELGMPFSDPEAEGVDIQRAIARALAGGTRLRDVLAMVAHFRERDQTTPVILMGYLNPLIRMGFASFAQAASTAGADGVLIVNMPVEEGAELTGQLAEAMMDVIYLCAPTTTPQRIAHIAKQGSGFLYYVSLRGTTGAGHLDIDEVQARMAVIRGIVDRPVVVGFGIKTPEAAAAVAALADGVVVGAAIVRLIAEHTNEPEAALPAVRDFLLTMRRAIDVTEA